MAMGMKEWAGLAAAGIAVVAIWALPLSHRDLPGRARLAEVERFDELRAAERAAIGTFLATHWSDSLSELAVRTAVDGVAAGVPMDSITPERYRAWVEEIREISRSLEPRDPDMLLGIFHVNAGAGLPEGVEAPASLGSGTYIGVRDGTPYCMLVESWERPIGDRVLTPLQTLEGCKFYLQYGEPGPRIAAWLERGGFQFAVGSRRFAFPERDTPRRVWWDDLEAPVFGMRRLPFAIGYPPGGRCLAGDADSCSQFLAEAALSPDSWTARADLEIVRSSPIAYTRRVTYLSRFTSQDAFLMLDIEEAFGPEAFARFWTSEEEMADAFQSAFGADLGSWTADWMRSIEGPHWAGPAVRAGAPLYVLLTIMVFAAYVSLRARRREVG